MAELDIQLAELEIEYNEIVSLVEGTGKIPYASVEKELSSFNTELIVGDPSLDGLSTISETAFKLSSVRYRAGELNSQAINMQTIWKNLSDKTEEFYEKLKNTILIGDTATQEMRNQALQIASVNSKPLTKKALKLLSIVKTEYSLAHSHLLRCEEAISKVEFADKCLDKQIKGVNIQLFLNEIPKRVVPLAKYVKMTNDGGKIKVKISNEEDEEEKDI